MCRCAGGGGGGVGGNGDTATEAANSGVSEAPDGARHVLMCRMRALVSQPPRSSRHTTHSKGLRAAVAIMSNLWCDLHAMQFVNQRIALQWRSISAFRSAPGPHTGSGYEQLGSVRVTGSRCVVEVS